jgi:hypothetical protein
LRADVPAFVAAQLGGAAAALVTIRALYPDIDKVAPQVIVKEPT